MTTAHNLYERDFYLWTEATAQQLREGEFTQVDVANLIEEVESIGQGEKRELKSRLIVLLMHLLKWMYQPGKRSDSWINTISEQRIALEELLEDSPSLRCDPRAIYSPIGKRTVAFLPEVFEQCYQKARIKAAQETGIKLSIFPSQCSFAQEEVLEAGFFPEVLNKE
ncbi:DUF29 domain-containing protein [Moorena sp. SIO3H5]|uniref:DUF29 domain-containing protein n=1 Tax=Moorena sp. SIO3H5 TaxID=2607834 RepID=UPI0013BD05F0|nr:DUF29 domain-containing protein [Moorena sp. SIO3H5]NEO70235.1 DUF29 domain-containing protein [Moorena sp. SIO3H5]